MSGAEVGGVAGFWLLAFAYRLIDMGRFGEDGVMLIAILHTFASLACAIAGSRLVHVFVRHEQIDHQSDGRLRSVGRDFLPLVVIAAFIFVGVFGVTLLVA